MFMVYGDQFMPFLMSAILVLCFLYRFLVIIFLPINKLTDEFSYSIILVTILW